MWFFYIQELWASSSVYFLSNWKIDKKEYLILDMAASPWWKTTQLSEYYPNSFIVANEFDKNRTPQLISNIERMWVDNVWITNYNWQFIWRLTEVFDKILLDAPCSWEWIAFKSIESLKFWNIKNIKKINKLQQKLLESWLNSLKIWWDLLYSTCTMNKIENEELIKKIFDKYPWCFKIILQKRFWPHIDKTWWFFVCKIKKLKSITYNFKFKQELNNKEIRDINDHDKKVINEFCFKYWLDLNNFIIYKFRNDILILKKQSVYEYIKNRIYFLKLWKKIGKIEKDNFIPNYYIWRDFILSKMFKYEIKNKKELDNYFKWFEIWWNIKEKYIQIQYNNCNIWLGILNKENWKIKNWFPVSWIRK